MEKISRVEDDTTLCTLKLRLRKKTQQPYHHELSPLLGIVDCSNVDKWISYIWATGIFTKFYILVTYGWLIQIAVSLSWVLWHFWKIDFQYPYLLDCPIKYNTKLILCKMDLYVRLPIFLSHMHRRVTLPKVENLLGNHPWYLCLSHILTHGKSPFLYRRHVARYG